MVDDDKTVLEDKLELFSETDNYHIPDIKLEDLAKMEKKLNFKELAMEYYDLYELLKIDDSIKEDTSKKMEVLLSLDGEFKSYVEVLGIEAIKATHFHKTKTKAKFNKAVGIDQKSKIQKTALKSVKLKQNNFYSFKELKDLVKCAYDKLNVTCAAKATDVQSVYSVKSTSRNGVRGYLIIGKI